MKQVLIVTGASSGMGSEFALQLAEEYIRGARSESAATKAPDAQSVSAAEIWLIARNKEQLDTIAGKITKMNDEATRVRHDGKTSSPAIVPRVFAVDISGRKGVERFSELLERENKESGPNGGFSVPVLVNNAGFGTYGPFAETNMNRELDMIDLNCTALTGICSLVLPYFESGSRIINVASLASFIPLGNFAVYGATKSYVLSFTMALAAELKDRGIKVCALCPGPVSTNFANVASNGARKAVRHGLDPRKVVAHCLRRSESGKHTAIMAFKWKFKAAAGRFVGRYAGARFTYLFCKRPSNKTPDKQS
jgi:short-subunit dehydrogenase